MDSRNNYKYAVFGRVGFETLFVCISIGVILFISSRYRCSEREYDANIASVLATQWLIMVEIYVNSRCFYINHMLCTMLIPNRSITAKMSILSRF